MDASMLGSLAKQMEKWFKPYKEGFARFNRLPDQGLEREAMTAGMLAADKTPDEIVGVVSSGGTESILLAMKTYRDWARATRGISSPEIIAPTTAHAAFDKAGQYFGLKGIRIPVGSDFRADVAATRAAITAHTIALIGSPPPPPPRTDRPR